MNKETGNEIPYSPNWLYRIFAFIKRLPINGWPLIVLLALLGVSLSHLVAWSKGLIDFPVFRQELAGPTLFFVAIPALWIYLDRLSSEAIRGFFQQRESAAMKVQDLTSDFLSLPSAWSVIIFVLGILSGFVNLQSIGNIDPLYLSVMPIYSLGSFAIINGLIFLIAFRIVRQGVFIRKLLKSVEINIFDPTAIYSLSRYFSKAIFSVIVVVYILGLSTTSDPLHFFTDPTFIFIQLIVIGVMVFSFFAQLGSANARMRQEKDRLISDIGKQLNEFIEQSNKASQVGDNEKLAELRQGIAAMQANWSFVKKVPTWPWEPATLRTILFPLLFPVIVYLIQQFVGRILDF